MEHISATRIGWFVIASLLAFWAIEKAAAAYPSPHLVVMEQPAMVPVYELRRQREELSFKTGRWRGIT